MLDICLCRMCILSQPFLSLIVFWQSVVIVLSKCNGGGKSIGNNSNIQHQNQKTNHYIPNKSASQHKAQISSCRSYIAWKFVTDWRNCGSSKLLNMGPWCRAWGSVVSGSRWVTHSSFWLHGFVSFSCFLGDCPTCRSSFNSVWKPVYPSMCETWKTDTIQNFLSIILVVQKNYPVSCYQQLFVTTHQWVGRESKGF
jgi:hypothetical protein